MGQHTQPYYVRCPEHGFMPMSERLHAVLVHDSHFFDGCDVDWGRRDELDNDPLELDADELEREALA